MWRTYLSSALIVIVLMAVPAKAIDIGFIVGSADTAYGSLHSNYTSQIDFLSQDYGATVTTLYDTATFNTAAYDLLVISEDAAAANVAHMVDSVVPIFVIDRYMYDTFKLATGEVRPSVPTPARSYRVSATNWISKYMMDTLELHGDYINYLVGYTGCAAGVDPIYNFVSWATTPDTLMCGVVDSGGALTSGVAAQRRAFAGVYHNSVATMSWCSAWELYGRIIAWLDYDTTVTNAWLTEICFAGPYEVQSCWTEVGADDSAIYVSQTRWGTDNGNILTFQKINSISIDRKMPTDFSADSIRIDLGVESVALNDPDQADTTFDFRIGAYKIISEWWRCPTCTGGGFPRDSIWVNRYDAVGGLSKTAWDAKDLTSGTDYDATFLDTFHCTIETQDAGDTMFLTLTGSLFNGWVSDTSGNYGWFLFPDTIYDNCDSCDAEIMTDDCYGNQTNPDNLQIRVWFSASEEEPVADKASIGSGVKIGAGVKF